MISLRREDLLKLDCIGAGNFGTIYKNGDFVYKVYKEMVKTEYGFLCKNPSLKLDKIRINRMMRLDRKLKYTDLVKDILFIDGKFGGVVLPYYEGETLVKTKDDFIKDKFDFAYQLVRNSEELTDNNIYPNDYKLNNIMVVGGDIKLIDLDDYFTLVCRIPYSFRKKDVVLALDETIKAYFGENCFYPFAKDVVKLLGKDLTSNYTYQDVTHYIDDKKKKYNYVFINEEVDFYKNIELLRNNDYRTVYVYSGYDYNLIGENIKNILNLGINLYDVTSSIKLKSYIQSIMYDECIGLKKDKVLNLKSK